MNLRNVRTVAAALALLAPLLSCDTSTDDATGPAIQQVPIEGSHQFFAYFASNPTGTILWRMREPWAGTVDATGRFTAWGGVGVYHVIAYLMSDTTEATAIPVEIVPYSSFTPIGLPAWGIALNSNGTLATADKDGPIRLRKGTVTRVDSVPGSPFQLAYAPDGATLYATTLSGKVVKIDVATAHTLGTLTLPGAAYAVVVHPTSGAIYVTTDQAMVYRIDPAAMAVTDSAHLAWPSNGMVMSADGSDLWIDAIDSGRVYRFASATLAALDSFTTAIDAKGMALAPSGDSLYVACESMGLYVIRPSTRSVSAVPLLFGAGSVTVSSDGTKLVVAQPFGYVTTLDRATMTVLGGTAVGGTPRNVIAIPGSTDSYVSTMENTVLVH